MDIKMTIKKAVVQIDIWIENIESHAIGQLVSVASQAFVRTKAVLWLLSAFTLPVVSLIETVPSCDVFKQVAAAEWSHAKLFTIDYGLYGARLSLHGKLDCAR